MALKKLGCLQVYFSMPGGCPRKCLHAHHQTHTNNHFIVRVSLVEGGKCWQIMYHCYAEDCKRKLDLNIGRIMHTMAAMPDAVDEPMDESSDMMPDGYFAPRPSDMYETYNEPDVRALPHGHRVLALCSPCGTGKTKMLNQFVDTECLLRNIVLLDLTHRRILTSKVVMTMPMVRGAKCLHYTKDLKGEIFLDAVSKDGVRSVAIQYESLGR